MINQRQHGLKQLWLDLGEFGLFLLKYSRSRFYRWFAKLELAKDILVDILYKKRGRYARPLLHFLVILGVFFAVGVGPYIFDSQNDRPQAAENITGIDAAVAYGGSFYTQQSEEVRQFRGGEIVTHVVESGETITSIAEKYGLRPETIIWENDLNPKATLKPGQTLRILPIDGIRHKVARGETIYSIGKKYGLEGSEVQKIVDYPFNEFLNDETFELAVGQWIMVPDGVKPEVKKRRSVYRKYVAAKTPDAGAVSATGSFVWPASGRITQGYRFYHKAIDIANHGGGPILAADAGTVIAAGWDPSGYGRKIVIDHGNGYMTLYAHLSVIQVSVGQRVNRGNVIGQMGSTGRSTGTHLHFEIRRGGVLLNPLTFLK